MQPDRHSPLATLLFSACTFSTNGLDPPSPETIDTSTNTSIPDLHTTTNPATTIDPTTTSATTSTPDASTSTTASDTTSVPPDDDPSSTGSLDPGECIGDTIDNEHCSPNTPYCVDDRCVDCTTLDCATIAPNKPACDEYSGRCVECLHHDHCLDEAKPACDEPTATCTACTEHAECPATACDLETGKCLPEDCVYYVNLTKAGMFPCNDASDGKSVETPLCTLQKAATLLQPDKPCTIKITAGTQNQSLPAAIAKGNITVAIVHYGGVPSLTVPKYPALTVSPGNRLYMNRIAIANVGSPAIECNGGIVWLDSQRIYNTGTALHAKDCGIHVRRSIFFGHTAGALDIQGIESDKAHLWLENSYITTMTSNVFGAIRLIGNAKADLLYTTIALVKSGASPPIECVVGFTGTINIRNSAIIGPQPRYGAACISKLNIDTSHESTEGTQAELTGTFSSFAGGQFQAEPRGPLMNAAIWRTGDPKTDQDGNPRPAIDGTKDYAGADRPSSAP